MIHAGESLAVPWAGNDCVRDCVERDFFPVMDILDIGFVLIVLTSSLKVLKKLPGGGDTLFNSSKW